MRVPKERRFGAICHAGGRDLEITSKHQEWLNWALNALREQEKRDVLGAYVNAAVELTEKE